MKLILYKLVIAVVVYECCTESLFPNRNGCSQPYYYVDTDDLQKCTRTLYCLNYIPSMAQTSNTKCLNSVNLYGSYYDPLSVIFSYDNSYDVIPEFGDSVNQLIYSLDLSDNGDALFVPNLGYMPNLVTLKIMRCPLQTAKLSNKYELPALKEIDYSQNNIQDIEVVPGEYEYKSLQKLNISHNDLVNIPEAIFEPFPNIETLDLSHNSIQLVDIMSFEVRKLLHLNLSNNRIADINSSLLRLRYLVTLDLSHNKLQILKANDFVKLVNLQELKLDSNDINTIEKTVFENMASLIAIDLRDNVVETVDREIFTNATKLTTAYLSRNKLKNVPINMFQGKVISDFTIEGNQIEGPLEKDTFEGLSMVTELDLSFQHITSIKNYAFAGLTTLETLLLNNNDLESLSNYSLKGLQNLNCLDLSYNRIDKLEIVTEDLYRLQILTLHHNKISHISSNLFFALGPANRLQLLDLSNNNISYLEPKSFRTLQNLLNFKISDNPLTGSIKEKTFNGLGSLPNLDISGTLINTVCNGSFTGMTALKDLNVSHSNITELQYNSLSYAGNIQAIDLSYNQLSAFDVNTTGLRYLKTLMLNNNLLQVISQTIFNGLSVLTTVDLSYNQLRTIRASYALENMRYLDLSYNSELVIDVSFIAKAQNLATLYITGTKFDVTFDVLNEIPLTKLEMAHLGIQNISRLNLNKLERLETLVLSYNGASKLEVGALSNLTVLRYLDLSCNNFYYIQPGAFKDNSYLKVLNISHNKLFEINYGMLRGLMSVELIDLSYNKIKSLHRSRFYGIEHLNTLVVDYNDIDFISDGEFAETGLTKLSIGHNPVSCEILVSLKKKSNKIFITSVNTDLTKANVDGVTCNNDGYNFHSKLTPTNAEHDRLLLDIRNILYNVSNDLIVKEPTQAKYNYFPYLANITEQEEKLNQRSLEITKSIKNLSSVSNVTSMINTDTNVLLGKILRVLSAKVSIQQTTRKPIIINKENATSDSLVSYINKIKQELEDSVALEKQYILELDDKIAKLNLKLDSSVPMKTPVHEKLLGASGDRQKSSMFTEICVGLILVILVGSILFIIYKSGCYKLSGRAMTSSTRNIAESMETAQL